MPDYENGRLSDLVLSNSPSVDRLLNAAKRAVREAEDCDQDGTDETRPMNPEPMTRE